MPIFLKKKAKLGNSPSYRNTKSSEQDKVLSSGMGTRTRSDGSTSTSSSVSTSSLSRARSAKTAATIDSYLEELANRSLSTIYSEDEIERPFDEVSDDFGGSVSLLTEFTYHSNRDDDMSNSDIFNVSSLDLDDYSGSVASARSRPSIKQVPGSLLDRMPRPQMRTDVALADIDSNNSIIDSEDEEQFSFADDDSRSNGSLSCAASMASDGAAIASSYMDESKSVDTQDGSSAQYRTTPSLPAIADDTTSIAESTTIFGSAAFADDDDDDDSDNHNDLTAIPEAPTNNTATTPALKSNFKYTSSKNPPGINRRATGGMSDIDADESTSRHTAKLQLLGIVRMNTMSSAANSMISNDSNSSSFEMPPSPPPTPPPPSVSPAPSLRTSTPRTSTPIEMDRSQSTLEPSVELASFESASHYRKSIDQNTDPESGVPIYDDGQKQIDGEPSARTRTRLRKIVMCSLFFFMLAAISVIVGTIVRFGYDPQAENAPAAVVSGGGTQDPGSNIIDSAEDRIVDDENVVVDGTPPTSEEEVRDDEVQPEIPSNVTLPGNTTGGDDIETPSNNTDTDNNDIDEIPSNNTDFNDSTTDAPVNGATTTDAPTSSPTDTPTTDVPTSSPTDTPTTDAPTSSPTDKPTTDAPTSSPTDIPTSSPTDAPVSGPTDAPILPPPTCKPVVAVDKLCYVAGVDSIRMTLDVCNPLVDDWVGFFPADSASMVPGSNAYTVGDEYVEWFWTCGTKDCVVEDENGVLTATRPVIAITLPSDPFEVGQRFRVHLIRDSPDMPYISDAQSEEFIVVADACP